MRIHNSITTQKVMLSMAFVLSSYFLLLACEDFTYTACRDCSPRGVCLLQGSGSEKFIGGSDPAFPTGVKTASGDGWHPGEIYHAGEQYIYCTYNTWKIWLNQSCSGKPANTAHDGTLGCGTAPKYTADEAPSCSGS